MSAFISYSIFYRTKIFWTTISNGLCGPLIFIHKFEVRSVKTRKREQKKGEIGKIYVFSYFPLFITIIAVLIGKILT